MGAKKHQPARDVLIDRMADHVTVTGHVAKLGSADVIYVDTIVELGGYCPVAYKMAGKAIPGKPSIATTYEGKTYFFVKPKARAAFLKAPEQFVPVMGGKCIVCKSTGKGDVAGDPRIFSVYKGKVYLFAGQKQKERFDANPEEFTGKTKD